MIKQLALGAAAVLLAAGAANAQTAGTFGATSEGTFTINADLAPVVRVSGLDNMNFAIGAAFLNGTNPNVNSRFDYCVYSNVSSAGTYTLSVDGGTPSGNGWLLTGAGTDSLKFTINSYAGTGGTLGHQMAPGRSFQFRADGRGVRPNTADCSDTGENTQIVVAISRGDILAANAGSYTGTVRVIAAAL
jgi:hypothetical protein